MIALVFLTLLRFDQVQERANIVARVHIEPEQVALADDVHLTLSVTGPASLTVEPIGEWSFPGWRLREAKVANINPGSDWQRVFRVSPERAGDVPLVIPRLRVQVAGRSSPTEIAFEPLMIRVTTELPRVDVDEAHPVTGPERPPFEEARSVWPWIVIGSLGLLAIILWLRRPKAIEPEPAPEEWARRELTRLASMNGDCRGLADTLAAMIRGYLQRKYQVDAVGRTTREMSADLHQAGLADRRIDEWQNLLNRCDLAKFARAEFAKVEATEAIRCAQSLLSATLPVSESPSPAKTGKLR